jgi:predicted HTH transcriptional regulator
MSKLLELIAQGEHTTQDFKFRVDDQRKIARTLCAFANSAGGRLLIGVKDNRKISGCDPHEEIHMIEGAAKVFCLPEITFTSKVWQEDHKLVLEIQVKPSDQKPHKAKDDDGKWKSYIRINDQTIVVNKILEWVWNEKQRKTAKPEKFDQEELQCLKLIELLQPVTLSKLYRKANLPLRKVDRLLVLFISWNLVEMVFERDGVYYKIMDKPPNLS